MFWGNILKQLKKSHVFYMIVRYSFAVAIAILLTNLPLNSLEYLGYDALFRLKPSNQTSGNLQILAVDRVTTEVLQRTPNLKDHTLVLQRILNQKPKAIIYYIDPRDLEANLQDRVAFARLAESHPHFYINVNDLYLEATKSKFQMQGAFRNLKLRQGILSADKKNFAGDGVSRRSIISFESNPFLQTEIAQLVTGPKEFDSYRGSFEFKGSYQTLTQVRPRGTYEAISFLDVWDGKEVKNLQDKVILVGQDAKFNEPNYLQTPFSRDITGMSRLEYNANVIDTLILDQGILQSPGWVNILATLLFSVLTLFITLRLRPLKAIFSILGMSLGIFIISWFLMSVFGFWFAYMHSLLAIFINYYFFIPYRLITENRKSWEYKKKNEILTQVEELKNNFISMMSHDLKTPLAKIQGMADMAMDGGNLDSGQKQALKSIRNSTEDLNSFINSVLTLGRVESQKIELNYQAKDINALIEQVVDCCRFSADRKNIEIRTELEPLFSVKMDADLIRQVLQNLIENAIKYSPEGSSILITSEEIGGELQVQISDQGLGIPKEEHEKIFMKFYRSKDVKISTIKGTGIGLYLSKFFVELHNGKIQVDSEPDQGSTFSVNLPLN